MRFCWEGGGEEEESVKGRSLEVGFGEVMEGRGDFSVEREVAEGEVGGLGFGFGLLMPRAREAGGPTGTMREPNSTPMVTSWWGEKRPSQRRMVSFGVEWSDGWE